MAVVAEISRQLLSMAGLEDVSHGPPDLEERIIADINRALDTCGQSNQNAFFQVRPDLAEIIRAPVTVNVTVTQGSKAITFNSGYSSTWMPGQAIMIEGDPALNRIVDEASVSTPSLAEPYLGSNATINATVYNDFITLPAGTRQVMDPVTLNKVIVLTAAQSASHLALRAWDYSQFYDRPYGAYVLAIQKVVQNPMQWFPFAQMCLGTLKAGIMLDTLPGVINKLCYNARVQVFAPVTSLADTRTTLMPQNADMTILLPVCRYYFSTYQLCSVPQQALQAEYSLALQRCRELSVFGNQHKRFMYSRER